MAKNVPAQLAPNLNPLQVFNAIRNAMPMYYNQIPLATQATLETTLNNVLSQPATRNAFVSTMLNQLGLQKATMMSWQNKLASLKKGFLPFGSSVQDTFVGTLEAKRYDADSVDMNVLFGKHLPEIVPVFYEQNRQDFYLVTINNQAIKQAFFSAGGFNELIDAILSAPMRSDERDEYRLTVQLLTEAITREWVHPVHVDAVSDAQTARDLLVQARGWAERLTFPSRKYNSMGVENNSRVDKLLLFVTPEVKAEMDVNALAAAFNLSLAEATARVITVDDFGVPNVTGILCDEDFFQIYDTQITTAEMANGATLSTNIFLHHWQIFAISRFSQAVLFTRDPVNPDEDGVVWDNVEVVVGDDIEIGRGMFVRIEDVTVTATSTPPDIDPPQGVSFELTGAGVTENDNATIPLDRFTDVTPDGLLTVGFNEPNAALTLTVTSVFDHDASERINITVVDAQTETP